MVCLFILSYILIIYSFLRIRKTDKKLNILLWLFTLIIIYMCYDSMVVYILTLCSIKATLLVRSIINIIISVVIFLLGRKKQEYYFDKLDLGVIIILLYFVLIIFLCRFGTNFNIKFEIDDANVHFALSKMFALNNTINDPGLYDVLYNSPNREMFLTYTNCGTFLQLLKPIIGIKNLYKGFILFEMLSFYLGGVLLYFIVKSNKVDIKKYILTIVMLIIYLLGYPLTNLLYGFHYWGMIIILIETIIIMIQEDYNNLTNDKSIILLLLLLTLGIFITYYLYVPVIYGAMGLYYIYVWKYKKKYSFNKMVKYIAITLIVPFVFGITYYGLVGTSTVSNNMQIDGGNYKNLIGNFIFVLPLIIYRFIKEIKNKKVDFVSILQVINIAYMVVLFILCINGKMSNYYFGKIYNLAWLLMFIYLIRLLYYDNNLLFKVYIYSYILIVILACFRIENIIDMNKVNISNNTVISNIGDIFDNNMRLFKESRVIINKDIYELLEHVHDNYHKYKGDNGEVHFATSYFRRIWIAELLDIVPCYGFSKNYALEEGLFVNAIKANDIKYTLNSDDIKYFVIFIDEYNYEFELNDYEIVYKNRAGYVLKKKYI